MREANLNVNGVTPLMHNTLIAQYDAIVAAIPEWDAMVPLTSHAPDALRRAYADGWRDGWNAHRISTLNCIAHHDPRKGAWYLLAAADALDGKPQVTVTVEKARV